MPLDLDVEQARPVCPQCFMTRAANGACACDPDER